MCLEQADKEKFANFSIGFFPLQTPSTGIRCRTAEHFPLQIDGLDGILVGHGAASYTNYAVA